MDNFFDILNAALDEAIADAKNPCLKRDVVAKEEKSRTKQTAKNLIARRRIEKWVRRRKLRSV